MAFGTFANFAKKVLDAAKKGGLNSKDLRKLDRLLTRNAMRNKILAAGLVSALRAGAKPSEVNRLSTMFEKASERIADGKDPFTEEEQKKIRSILDDAGISSKTSNWVAKHTDDLLAAEVNEFISGKHLTTPIVPVKKTMAVEKEKDKGDQKKLLATR
jgi:hypothetical protein